MIHQIKKVIYIAVGITLLIIAIIIGVYCFKQYNILHPAAANAAKVIDSAIIESGELEGAAMECVETVYKASLKRSIIIPETAEEAASSKELAFQMGVIQEIEPLSDGIFEKKYPH